MARLSLNEGTTQATRRARQSWNDFKTDLAPYFALTSRTFVKVLTLRVGASVVLYVAAYHSFMASNDLLPGGKFPSRIATTFYLFGPFLAEEFARYRFAVVRAHEGSGAGQGSEPVLVEPARLSMNRMVGLLGVHLPPTWTAPIPRADCRNRDGSFDLEPNRKSLSAYRKAMTESGDPYFNTLTSLLKADDLGGAWHHIIRRFQGAYYHKSPSYSTLLANLATTLAGIEIFILRQLEGEGTAFLKRAVQIWRDFDSREIDALARQHEISAGVVIGALIQLCGRKGSGGIRVALDKANPNDRLFDPLEVAMWEPVFPNHKADPLYKLAIEKVVNPDAKVKPGRPATIERPPPAAAPEPRTPAPQSPVPPSPTSNPSAANAPEPALVKWNAEQDAGAGLSPLLRRKEKAAP